MEKENITREKLSHRAGDNDAKHTKTQNFIKGGKKVLHWPFKHYKPGKALQNRNVQFNGVSGLLD